MEKHRTNEMKFWTCMSILQIRFSFCFFSLKKKKKVFEIPVSAVKGHVESPTGSAVDIGRQKKTSRGHQQLPLA